MRYSRTYYQEKDFNEDFLDKLNFAEFLTDLPIGGEEVYESIKRAYSGIPLPEELGGCIFNFLSKQDVIDYLCTRYNLNQKRINDATVVIYSKSGVCGQATGSFKQKEENELEARILKLEKKVNELERQLNYDDGK